MYVWLAIQSNFNGMPISKPPSTAKSWPVTWLLRSLAKKSIDPIISSAVGHSPRGFVFSYAIIAFLNFSSPRLFFHQSVATKPGHTAFTLIPSGPRERDSANVMELRAPLEAA